MPVLVATITPRPEYRAEVRAALIVTVTAVQLEPGCELYALHEAEDCFVIIEEWVDESAVARHGEADAVATLMKQLDGKLQERLEVVTLGKVLIGDPEKGQRRR